MSHARRPLAVIVLLLSLTACGDAANKAADAESTNAAVGSSTAASTSAAGAAQADRGEYTEGDETSTWLVTAKSDGTFSIEDNAQFGDDGRASRIFYFDAKGTLTQATEQRTQTAQSPNSSPKMVRTEILVDFAGGEPMATKKVDDATRTVEPYEIENLKKRADALRKQAHR